MVTRAKLYEVPNLEKRRRNLEREQMEIEVGGIERRTSNHNILNVTFPSSASEENDRQRGRPDNINDPARYIKPEPPTEESFAAKRKGNVRLPAIRRDITITELDRQANKKILESLISNKFQRDLIKDL